MVPGSAAAFSRNAKSGVTPEKLNQNPADGVLQSEFDEAHQILLIALKFENPWYKVFERNILKL